MLEENGLNGANGVKNEILHRVKEEKNPAYKKMK
jgi:hypothetical protein